MDRRPRRFPDHGTLVLEDLVALVQQEIRGITLREALSQLEDAERRAEEQHARFAAFMDHLPNVAFMKDATGRTTYINRRHQEAFGIAPAELLGRRDDDWLPLDVSDKTMAADRQVLSSGRPSVTPEEIPTTEGLRHWLTFKFPVPTANGDRLLGGVAVDITEQKRIEQQLQEISALQRAILDSANLSIISTEPDGTIRTFNASSERLLGYRAEEVVGKQTPGIFHLRDEVERHAEELSRKLGFRVEPGVHSIRWGVENAECVEREWTFVRKDGSTFPAALSLTALRDDSGEVTGYVGVMRDVLAQHEAETAMRTAKEAAESANRAKSQFVANMSHEVRTPLNGILGVTAMLLETSLKPDQRQLAEIIQSSGEGLLSIVNDVLDFSKIEAGRIELEEIDFSLSELLASVVDLNSARASAKCLTVESDLEAGLPSHLHGDPLRLRQVLNNLIGNAIKFSERGRVHLSARILPAQTGCVKLRFAITDTGIGIPIETQAHIFEPFTQAELSTTRRFGGTGLGLSICRQLVELMGGEIGLESEPNQGATFWFTAEFGPALARSLPPRFADRGEIEPLPKLRVLLAEDSSINRLVATHQLQKLGCNVETVENGQQAVDAAAAGHYDAIFMDCQMPVMDGYAATTEIRRMEGENGGHTRIIALTANAMSGERERCLAIGMDDYLSKPFKMADLRAALASNARKPEAQADAHHSNLAPLDHDTLEALRDECRADGGDLFGEYVAMFEADAEDALAEFSAAEATENLDRLTRAAHRLRGCAANFGAARLMRFCAQIEKRALSEDFHEARAVLPLLREELTRVRTALSHEEFDATASRDGSW
jgi:PAS domain S-box-containing protein